MVELKRTMAPTDLAAFGEAGVRAAAELAQRVGARLLLLHVISEEELERRTNAHVPRRPVGQIYQDLEGAMQEQFRRAVPADVRRDLALEALVTVGAPIEEILRMAWVKATDMMVMATHGRTGVARMVKGSVAERVLREAPCPVLTVRPQEAAAELAA